MRLDQFADPLTLHRDKVRSEWVDEYDHMNLSYYVLICDQATYEFWKLVNDDCGIDDREGLEYAVVETHVNYLQELRLNDPVRVCTRLVAYDSKRFRIFHELFHDSEGFLSATNEVMALGFNLNKRAICNFGKTVQGNLAEIYRGHADLETPRNAGRAISFSGPRKS